MSDDRAPIVGKNGVVVTDAAAGREGADGYRTYEVYQRQRIGESTEKLKPGSLSSDAYRVDPYPLLHPCRSLPFPFWTTPNCCTKFPCKMSATLPGLPTWTRASRA